MGSQIFSGIIWASQSGSGLEPRVIVLENNVHKYEVFEVINSGTTGTLTISEHSALLLDQYPDAEDCLILAIDPLSGRPIEEYVYDGNSQPVSATLDLNGNWEITNESAFAYPVAIVYQIQLAEKYKNELDNTYILHETCIESATATTYDDTNTSLGSVNVQDAIETVQLDNPGIKFDLLQNTSPTQGEIKYNMGEGGLQVGEMNGVVLDVGREMFAPIKNQSGADLVDGSVVMYDGAVGARGKLKAIYATITAGMESRLILGVVTETISNGNEGLVTNYGKVRGINTTGSTVGETWSEGDILFASVTNPGKFTNVEPEAPYPAIPIAVIINVHATMGTIFVRPTYTSRLSSLQDVDGAPTINRQLLKWDTTLQYWKSVEDITLVAKDTTGIPKEVRDNFTIDYDYTTRVLTLTHLSDWYYYYKGEKVNITSNITMPAHTNTYGIYHYYFTDTTKSITLSTTPWNLDENVPITLVLFNPNAVSAIKGFALEERHGLRDTGWHYNQHFAEGAKYISGFDVADFTLDSDAVASTTWSVSSGVIADEDLITTTTALPDGGPYTILFQNASNQWDWITGSATPYFISGGYITYNPIGSGLTPITSNVWFNLYQVQTPAISPTFQNVVMVGRATYSNLANAQVESFNTYFTREGFIPEYVPVVQFNMRCRANYSTTTGRSRIDDYRYIRGTVIITGGSSVSTLPASAITVDTSAFDGRFSATEDTAQKIFDLLDDLGIDAVSLGTILANRYFYGDDSSKTKSVVDASSLTESGMYFKEGAGTSTPDNGEYHVLNLKNRNVFRQSLQLASKIASTGNLWMRNGLTQDTFTFTNWIRLLTTNDSYSGTYTPTVIGGDNIQSVAAFQCHYSVVGNTVTVGGKIGVDITTASAYTVVKLSIPVVRATAFTAEHQAGGSAVRRPFGGTPTDYGLFCVAGSIGDTSYVVFFAETITKVDGAGYHFTFTYTLI